MSFFYEIESLALIGLGELFISYGLLLHRKHKLKTCIFSEVVNQQQYASLTDGAVCVIFYCQLV